MCDENNQIDSFALQPWLKNNLRQNFRKNNQSADLTLNIGITMKP